MKKIILSIFLVCIMALGTFVFVGCGGGDTGAVVYELFHAQIEKMNEEGTPFIKSTQHSVTSDYFLSSFKKKTTALTFADYGWQDDMIALGMNYIVKFYPNTQDYTQGQDIGKIRDTISKLDQSYQALKDEYAYIQKVSSSEDMTIYNGIMANYGEKAREFSICVYDCAQALSDYLGNHVYKENAYGTAQMDYQMISVFTQSTLLDVYNDYNDLIMKSGKGVVASPNTAWFALQDKLADPNFAQGQKETLVSYVNALNQERKLTQRALENFSYYDYQVLYNGDVKAYSKTNSLAEQYHTQINRYFVGSSSHLSNAYKTFYTILYT